MAVSKGDKAIVARGVKVPRGTTGTVIWTGETKFGWRVGIKDAAGTVHWTAMGNVDAVAAPAPAPAPLFDEPTPGIGADRIAALEARVAALEAALATTAPAPFIPDGTDPLTVSAFTM